MPFLKIHIAGLVAVHVVLMAGRTPQASFWVIVAAGVDPERCPSSSGPVVAALGPGAPAFRRAFAASGNRGNWGNGGNGGNGAENIFGLNSSESNTLLHTFS